MKLEILFKNKDYESSISDIKIDPNISVNKQLGSELDYITYELMGDLLECAKILSNLCDEFISRKIDCYISVNEAAEYFNLALYPQFNKFERNLRKLMYILAVKSNDEAIVSYANMVEKWDFYKLMNTLFNKSKPITAIKKRQFNSDFIKQMVENDINKLSKQSLWAYFVAEKSYLSENYQKIINYRDSVMHAENMNFKKFIQINHSIGNANDEISLLIVRFAHQTPYMTVPIRKIFDKIIKQMVRSN